MCYSRCKERGILNDVVFYYQLKILDSHGFFVEGSISHLHTRLPYSQSSIWKKLNRLVQHKLIKKHANGYQLISYDDLFDILGYDLSYHKGRKGSFKIHKIPLEQCNHIKDLFAFIDIRDNLNTQVFRAFGNLTRTNQYSVKKLYCSNTDQKRVLLKKIVTENLVHMIDSNDQNANLCQMHDAFDTESTIKHCNPDITLSLKGICRLLRLSNTSSAHIIVQRLIKQKKLLVSTRKMFIETTTLSYSQFKKNFDDRYTLKDGMIFRTLSNQISCINN